jgi:hypothetical protein
MADAKISQLPVATTPLAGTELVPLVQGGVTVQSTVDKVLTGTVPSGTANGVLFLNGSKVVTSGSALTFDGTNFTVGYSSGSSRFNVSNNGAGGFEVNPDGTAGGPTLLAYNRVTPAYLQMTYAALDFVWQRSGSDAMVLTSTGLGIGTSSPAYKLQVAGTGAFANNSNENLFLVDTASPGRTSLQVSSQVTFFNGNIDSASQGVFIWRSSNAYTERMTLDASGNLGLGVTPSAWASTSKAIQLGTIGFLENNDNVSQYIGRNGYRASGGWTYSTSSPAQLFGMEASGNFAWFTAPSGTAGNAISFTQAMTLDASGNLLVGTTGASGNLLIVNGSTRSMLQGSRTNAAFQVDNTNGAPTWQQPNLIGHYFTGSQDAVSLRVPSSTNGSTGSYDIFADGSHIWYAAGGSNVTGSTATERARIPAAGGMVVGTAALATSATDGFLYVPTCAGTPTGTPTTQTGTAPIVVDTTNHKLYFYSGGTWRDAGP